MPRLHALAFLVLLAGCAGAPLTDRPEPIGDFRLGHAIAKVERPETGPFSRVLPDEVIKASVENAVRARLGRYDGDGLYHLGMAVGGYVLAQPGVPLIYSPKSVMIVDVTIFDNSTQQKITPEPIRITAFEGVEKTVPIIGSGYARQADEQLENLSAQVAVQLENWIRKNPELFVVPEGHARVAYDPPPPAVIRRRGAAEEAQPQQAESTQP